MKMRMIVCVWVNRKKCDNDLKKKLMTELHELVRGKIKEVSLSRASPVHRRLPILCVPSGTGAH